MRKIVEKGKYILVAFMMVIVFVVSNCNVFAEETEGKVVKVGYYENENF